MSGETFYKLTKTGERRLANIRPDVGSRLDHTLCAINMGYPQPSSQYEVRELVKRGFIELDCSTLDQLLASVKSSEPRLARVMTAFKKLSKEEPLREEEVDKAVSDLLSERVTHLTGEEGICTPRGLRALRREYKSLDSVGDKRIFFNNLVSRFHQGVTDSFWGTKQVTTLRFLNRLELGEVISKSKNVPPGEDSVFSSNKYRLGRKGEESK